MTDQVAETKVYHNTTALEEAILVAVKSAAAPAQQAIAEAQFVKAKALLLRILAICALILVTAFVIFLLWQLFFTQIPKLWSEKNQQTIVSQTDDLATESNKDTSNTTSKNVSGKTGTEINNSTGTNGVTTTTSSGKEEKLREILKQKTSEEPKTNAKTTRPNDQNKKMTEKLINPNSTIGNFTSSKNNINTNTSTAPADPVIIENMIVGPEVQTLTVFNSKDIKLANGLDVQITAGHQYANNSSTKNWRLGYCYVNFWNEEMKIRVDLATKPGKNSPIEDNYINDKQIEALGGEYEVSKLRRLCPWID